MRYVSTSTASSAVVVVAMTTRRADTDAIAAEIRRALGLIMQPGDVIELRVLHAGRSGTLSGYYDETEALVRDAVRLDCRGDLPGIYVTANPVNRTLLARASNRFIERAKHTSADVDIVHRRRLLIDLDPVRPAGVSSTDAEHDAALALAHEARAWLAEIGIPADSVVTAVQRQRCASACAHRPVERRRRGGAVQALLACARLASLDRRSARRHDDIQRCAHLEAARHRRAQRRRHTRAAAPTCAVA